MKNINSLIEVNSKSLFIRYVEHFENRPAIIFLHDSLGCVQLWRDFPDKLCEAARCNMLVYDRLGYGKSDPMLSPDRANSYMETEADTLVDVLDHLAIREAILFGHSDGASIALIAAGKYPQRFKAVVSEAAHVFVEQITLEGIRTAVDQYSDTDLKKRLEKYHGDKTDTVFRAWTETWLSEQFSSWNIEHFLLLIECPVLVIQGEMDEYGTLLQVESIVNNVGAKAEVAVIPGIGHTPHKEDQKEVLLRSIAFICESVVISSNHL